jgi:quercetin dioxygenase-like cupin family protein
MKYQYKLQFDQLEWEVPFEGVRHKYLDQNGLRLRLVEYSANMPAHWCEKGHYGYLLEGRMEIEYDCGTIIYNRGDGMYLPEGPDHKHRAKILTDTALVFFVETI